MSVLGWMAQYEDVRVEPTSRVMKAVRLRKLAEAIDPDLDLMQLQVEAALEELGTNDSLLDAQPSHTGLIKPASSSSSGPSSTAAKAESRRELFASGLEAESLRLQLRWAAGSKWDGVVIDVNTAFLLAPARQRNGSKIAVAVPRLIKDAGLLEPTPGRSSAIGRCVVMAHCRHGRGRGPNRGCASCVELKPILLSGLC